MPDVRVLDSDAVAPQAGAAEGLSVQPTFGPATGLDLFEQSILSCGPGRCGPIDIGEVEETLYVMAGRGTITVRGESRELAPGCGVYLPRASRFTLDVTEPDPMRLVAVRLLDPAPGPPTAAQVTSLPDCSPRPAGDGRSFRVLAGPETGLRSATLFVGEIPPGRAPDHFHAYDELLVVLEGTGVLHSPGVDDAVGPGSCVQLPARAVHCLENTGGETMRIVAIARPAASPAAAFAPDGTPAFGELPSG